MNISVHVGKKIKELRVSFGSTGISQEELALKLDVTPNTVSRWETATYKPKLQDLDKLANFFGVTISTFFPTEESEQIQSALLRAAKAAEELPESDKNAIRDFIEFKRAQYRMKHDK